MRWLLALILSTTLCLAHGGEERADSTCHEARRRGGWCEADGAGYVASVAVRSRILYEALDPHGHDFEPSAIACTACRRALDVDGFCRAHRIGFVGGKGYLSPLTYHLARGRAVDPDAIECPVCRENARGIGWCEKHDIGMAGATAVADRASFEELARARAILLAAVEMSARCETCAAAMVADGYCPDHRVHYRDGRPAPATPP